MKVLILTNPEYKDFVLQAKHEHPDELSVYYGKESFFGTNYIVPNYDVGISFMYLHKVPYQYELERHAWINFHPAPLPDYKGRNLCYHAIMNGEKVFGATVHYMDENFDTGEIIDVEYFDIKPWMTAEDVSVMAVKASMYLFQEYLPMILSGEVPISAANLGGTYYKKEPIESEISLPAPIKRQIRAITYKQFYPTVDIGGVKYKIVRDE